MQKFSPNADYRTVLNRLKSEFEKKWNENKPSTAEKLTDYEDIRVLGSGAFGVVVSKLSVNPLLVLKTCVYYLVRNL